MLSLHTYRFPARQADKRPENKRQKVVEFLPLRSFVSSRRFGRRLYLLSPGSQHHRKHRHGGYLPCDHLHRFSCLSGIKKSSSKQFFVTKGEKLQINNKLSLILPEHSSRTHTHLYAKEAKGLHIHAHPLLVTQAAFAIPFVSFLLYRPRGLCYTVHFLHSENRPSPSILGITVATPSLNANADNSGFGARILHRSDVCSYALVFESFLLKFLLFFCLLLFLTFCDLFSGPFVFVSHF